jgi:alpha-L-fucosidase
VTGGGNLLLNVGPAPDGLIDTAQVQRLKEIGEWLRKYGESVYGTRGGPLPRENWGGTTWRGNTLYVHILNWIDNVVRLPLNGAVPLKCVSLTGGGVTARTIDGFLELEVSADDRLAMDTIIKIEFARPCSRMTGVY